LKILNGFNEVHISWKLELTALGEVGQLELELTDIGGVVTWLHGSGVSGSDG